MLSKFLLVGVGGSGGKTLRALKNNLELRLTQAGWDTGLPAAWQLLHIDSPVIQDGTGFPAPMLPATDYMGLSKAGQKYTDAYQRMMTFVDGQDKEDFKSFIPFLELKVSKRLVNLSPSIPKPVSTTWVTR